MPIPQITFYVCRNCGWADFHPVGQCPRCNGEVNQSTPPSEGKIVTYTSIRYPPKGFENEAPYIVAIVDLKKGPRVIGRISNSEDEMKIGSSVSLESSKDGVLEFRLSG